MNLATLFIAMVLAGGIPVSEEQGVWEQEQNIPPIVWRAIGSLQPESVYVCSYHVNPFYLRGDFDGDAVADYAVLIKNTINGKIGLALVSGTSNRVDILGAGALAFGRMDDFNWLNAWYVYPKGKVEQGVTELPPPTLIADALMVEKLESASGIIYWTGEKYEWYQQGD